MKDIPETSSAIGDLQERLKNTLLRFSEYHDSRLPVAGSLRAALLTFYIRVIDFVVDLLDELARGRIATIGLTIVRSLKTKLDGFLRDLSSITNDVDQGASSQFQRKVLQNLDNLSKPSPSSSMPIFSVTYSASVRIFGLPSLRNPNFTGRQDALHQIFLSLHKDPSMQRWTAIYGMGGIGKTQLLLKYAFDCMPSSKSSSNPHKYDHVFYFNASSRTLLNQSISALVDALHIQRFVLNADNSDDGIVLNNWLLSRDNWLLVFDDVRDLHDVRWCLPTCDKGQVLFSTRYPALARMLDSESQGIEIYPMDDVSATALVSSMTRDSRFDEDKSADTTLQVVRFSKGVPLLMEQLVRNAFFSGRTVMQVLTSVRRKEDLLQQKNFSSLHEQNFSIGAMVAEIRESVRSESPQAEALLCLLAYLEPSSISLDLIKAGAKDFPSHIERPHTFERGQAGVSGKLNVEYVDRRTRSPSPSLLDHDPFSVTSMRAYWRLRRSNKTLGQLDLPREASPLEMQLRSHVGQHSAIGRLFSQPENIDEAVLKLQSAAIIRDIANETIWMHDVVAELLRALIEAEAQDKSRTTALVAATMVFLAFPLPHRHTSIETRNRIRLHFPHLLKTHAHLVELRILNDTSIGPELSHVIASTYSRGFLDIRATEGGLSLTESDRESRARALVYYRHAFAGYMASWRRLTAMPGVQEKHIVLSTYNDYVQVRSMADVSYTISDAVVNTLRYGRSAPWRALLTGLKVALLLEKEHSGLVEAGKMYRSLAPISRLFFGPADDHTKYIYSALHNCLMELGEFRQAYEVARETLEAVLKRGPSYYEHRLKLPSTRDDVVGDTIAQATRVGEACMQLEDTDKGKEAVRYFSIALQLWHAINGDDHYTSVKPMQRLAQAFEKCNEPVAASYWWGQSVLNCLNVLVWERLDDAHSTGPSVGTIFRSEQHYQDTIAAYEDARERLDYRLRGTGQDRIVLYQFLDHVESQINLYRRDRAQGRRWVGDKFIFSREDELDLQAKQVAEERWIENGGDPPEHMASAFAEMLAVRLPFAAKERTILT